MPAPSPPESSPLDCIILGGGPAGLAAAVYLGRYLRPTLILDHKKPQTRWHRPIAHNVLGFPAGIHRNQLLDWGRAHVAKYECVRTRRADVQTIAQRDGLFVLTDAEGVAYTARSLLLATGVEYLLPDLPDVLAFAGHSLWHCPECDGYKCLGKKIVIIGHDRGTAEMALNVSIWADEVVVCTHGEAETFDDESRDKLRAARIPILPGRITKILGNPDDGMLEGFELDGGQTVSAFGAFANQGCAVPDDLLTQLPLELHKGRWVKVDFRMRTNIPRCYAAGDIIANAQTQLSVAMGTGATAAIWMHKELLPPELCLSGRDW
jgi:thioredoxin reductase